jgi:8-oxo-dGTP diphosphatase
MRPLADGGEVWAAGGVVMRWQEGRPQVALVHRPRRDDWTFPKGHLEAGESAQEAALREVEEETALRCRPVRPVGRSRYVDHRGRPKVVDYWLMEVEAGSFAPNDEVDALVWVGLDDVPDALTYGVDRDLFALADLGGSTHP